MIGTNRLPKNLQRLGGETDRFRIARRVREQAGKIGFA